MLQPYLSVIIPAYNEASRIVPTIKRIAEYFAAKKMAYEILVVDDGSSDNTAQIIQSMADSNENIRLIRLDKNQGKGNAVKKGVMNSWGEMVYFTDADLSTPIEEIEKFLPEFPKYDIVIGSRAMRGSQVDTVWYRRIPGKLFNGVVTSICGLDFADTQCGAKMFRKDPAQEIFPRIKTAGFAFDVEILYVAKILGYKIKEVPIHWVISLDSRVHVLTDGIKMVLDVIKVRWIHRNTSRR